MLNIKKNIDLQLITLSDLLYLQVTIVTLKTLVGLCGGGKRQKKSE